MRLLTGMAGFLSVRVPESETVLTTPIGVHSIDLHPEDLILLDFNKKRVARNNERMPPDDISFAINAYQRRPTIFSIGHFHPPYATALSKQNKKSAFETHIAADGVGEILRVKCETCPHRFEGLCECIEGQRKSYGGVNTLLIEGDGIVTLGATLEAVCRQAEWVEQNAKTAYLCAGIAA